MLSRRIIDLAIMSAMFGPHPFDPPKPLGQPSLTPEQIKAQEKRARKAAKHTHDVERRLSKNTRAGADRAK